MSNQTKQDRIFLTAATLFWVALWQLLATIANRDLLIPLPTPMTTARALLALAGTSDFWISVGASLLRICSGFLAALVLGTLCALIASRCRIFRILTAPLLALIRAIPVASFTILVFLWVSRNRIPSVITFLTVFPIIWANVEAGADAMDIRLLEMAKVFGMSPWDTLRKIFLPGLRPFFLSAVAGGMGFAWKSGVAAEVICRTDRSLGSLLWASKSILEYHEVFAETLVIVLMSGLLQHLTKRLMAEKEVRG